MSRCATNKHTGECSQAVGAPVAHGIPLAAIPPQDEVLVEQLGGVRALAVEISNNRDWVPLALPVKGLGRRSDLRCQCDVRDGVGSVNKPERREQQMVPRRRC